MKVNVRSFAAFRSILGRETMIELAEGATVKDLLEALCAAHERLRPLLFGGAGLKEMRLFYFRQPSAADYDQIRFN